MSCRYCGALFCSKQKCKDRRTRDDADSRETLAYRGTRDEKRYKDSYKIDKRKIDESVDRAPKYSEQQSNTARKRGDHPKRYNDDEKYYSRHDPERRDKVRAEYIDNPDREPFRYDDQGHGKKPKNPKVRPRDDKGYGRPIVKEHYNRHGEPTGRQVEGMSQHPPPRIEDGREVYFDRLDRLDELKESKVPGMDRRYEYPEGRHGQPIDRGHRPRNDHLAPKYDKVKDKVRDKVGDKFKRRGRHDPSESDESDDEPPPPSRRQPPEDDEDDLYN